MNEVAGWEHFAHDADIGVRGWGPTAERAFEEAAQALSHIVTTSQINTTEKITVTCEAPNLELLFVDWLNAIIYEMAVRQMLFGRFAVAIEGAQRLRGTLWGERIDAVRHVPAVEPKGATCTALRVAREPCGGWSAACVVDV
jgi:SHS2 domain-containing protein